MQIEVEQGLGTGGGDEERLQFRIWHLLVLQLVVALGIALLLATEIAGALVLWGVTLLLLVVPVRREWARMKRLLGDVMAGAVMPAVCLVYDPGFLRNGGVAGLAVCLILFQIMLLLGWQMARYRGGLVSALFCGGMSVGALVAATIGILLLPISVIGILAAGLGLLGMTPMLTAFVFVRSVGDAYGKVRHCMSPRRARVLLFVGVLLAVVVPCSVGVVLGGQVLEWVPVPPGWEVEFD